ncbi:MAG: PAS domain S-box protein [Gallionella sp.]|nr:PAS domain S-box protein [Gallionella sp.]
MSELRILLLEDSLSDAELLEHNLRREGMVFTALRVDTEPAFKQALSDFKPDIVLADYNLPSYNGRAALDYVQRVHSGIPVVMVTGAIGEEMAVELLTAGARDYILKDRLARLPAAVRRVLSAEQGIRARKAAEKALQQSEADLMALVEHSPIAMIVDVGVEPDEKFVMMNRKFTELFGYTMEDVPDVHHWWPLAYPDEKYREQLRAEWTRRVEKAVQNHGDIEPMEATVTCKDGSSRYVKASLASIGSRNIVTLEDLTERKKAEEELERFFNLIPDLVCVASIDGHFLKINPAWQETLGYTMQEILSKPFLDFVHPDDLDATIKEVERQLNGEATMQFANRYLCKDGSYKWLEWRATPAVDGKLLFASARDVTERRQAEERIHFSEALLRQTQSLATIGSWRFYVPRNELIWSDETYRIFGISTGTPLSYEIFIGHVHPDDRVMVDSAWQAALKGAPYCVQHRIVVNGVTRWVEERAEFEFDAQGNLYSATGAVQDITERKQMEDEIKEVSDHNRTIMETANDAIICMKPDGTIHLWNHKAEEMFGHTAQEVIGQKMHQLITPDQYRGKEIEGLRQFAKTGTGPIVGKTLELSALRKNGVEFPIELSVSSMNIRGEWHATGIVRDITERKRAEQKLSESEKLYRSLFENMLNGFAYCQMIFEQDQPQDFIYLSVNAAFEALTGLKNVAGKRVSEVIPGIRQSDAKLFEIYGRVSLTGKPERFEIYVEALQQWFWISVYSPEKSYFVAVFDVITERKRAEIALKHSNRALATLSAVNKSLVRASDEDELLHAICQSIVEQRGYRMVWVGYTQHDENQSVKVVASAGYDEGYLDAINVSWAENERGMGPTGRAIRSGTTQLCQDFANDPRHLPWRDAALKRGYAASIALPLTNGEVFGALTVYADEVNTFTPDEVSLLEEMANDLAFGVRSLHIRQERDLALKQSQQRLEQLQDNLEDSVRAIASIVEMRDPYTAGHQLRVAGLAAAIAKQMGLPDEQIHGIHLAGIVHDLGKIQVPAEILSKPGKISDIEHRFIKAHPQAGYDILKDINFPWPISQMVLQHHERLDGSGYPQGLKGDQIIIGARILSVADVVEAMSSHRPYRVGLGVEAALEEIIKQRGIHFDPQVVDACLALFREQGYKFE